MTESAAGAKRRPTMRDVATLAGVSLKTVSRVVNGESRVAPATIAKVEDAVATLRFQRNDVARSLRPGHRTHTLGLVIEDLNSPFYPALMRSVDQVAQAHGYMLISASTFADARRERELVTALLGRRIDGLLLVPFTSDQRYISQANGGIPTVLIDRPARNLKADVVLLDDVGGTEQAVAHLVKQGHRRIAFIGDDASVVYSARRRLASFRRTVASAGLLDEELIVTASGLIAEAEIAHAEAAVHSLLALPAGRRPTAIITNDSRVTVGVLRALRLRPDTVALVGFDDLELGELLGITVVRTNPAEVGRVAAERVLERIGGRADRPKRIVVPTELVPRGSGEIAP
ncbi:MAG TPA: LacI family DNA-binding transcriptional regulator [Solirubrobacteraceae bacterium]|nr:LacI family DNA-binding transcriptional regulator [Solirubrobacteraceae bacterium]